MTKRRVLIPLDGSEFSRQIVQVVRTYVKPDEGELILLRVALPLVMPSERVFTPSASPMMGQEELYLGELETSYVWTAQEQATYQSQLAEELQREAASLHRLGYTASTAVRFGEPAQQIIEYVQAERIDLIAMTTHGRTGFGRFVLGSVAETVLRTVGIPVLMLRTVAPVAKQTPGEALLHGLVEPRALKIAAATDGSTFGEQAVKLAGRVAQTLGAQLTVLVVVSDQNSIEHNQQVMGETVDLVAGLQPKPQLVPLVGYADEALLEYLDKYPVDLLVLGAFEDRGVRAKSIGLTAQRVVQQASGSILVVKGHTPKVAKILACADVDDDLVVAYATGFAGRMGAMLDLLHVIPPTVAPYVAGAQAGDLTIATVEAQGGPLATVLQQWFAQLERQGFSREQLHLQQGAVNETILAMARDDAYDLIIVGSRASAGHFLNTTAHTIVSFAEQAVLVVRA